MSVGLLLITHNDIGSALLETATRTFGLCPIRAEALCVSATSDRDLLLDQASAMVRDLDEGDGVLVLTDMYGATPSNIADRISTDAALRVVAGVNLPMMIRVLNYCGLHLDALADKAISGGRDGIVLAGAAAQNTEAAR
jgi:PTS system ascorbate-specific IIA component